MSNISNTLAKPSILNKSSSNAGTTKPKSVFKKGERIDLSTFKSYTEEVSLMSSYLSESFPLTVDLPFQGTWLEILKGDRYYVFVTREGSLAILDSKEKVVLRDEKVSDSSIWTVGLSGDEKYLYIGGKKPIIKKYSFDTLKLEKEFVGHTNEINSVIISLNDEWMISCSDDKTVRFWSLNGRVKDKVLYTHSGVVFCMSLSSNNVYIASGSQDCTAIVYEISWDESSENGRILTQIKANSTVWAVHISYNNNYVVTGDAAGEILVWKFHTWELFRKYREDNRIRSIDISKDERTMVTAGEDKKVVIWHLNKETSEYALQLKGHTDMIKSAVFTHDENFIVSLADDTKVFRWKIPYFQEINVMKDCQASELIGVGANVVGLSNNEISIWSSIGVKSNYEKLQEYEFFLVTNDNHLFLISKTGQVEDNYMYKIYDYDLNTGISPISEYSFTTGQILSITVSNLPQCNFRYLCIGLLYKITTFLLSPSEIKPYNSQLYHDREVYKLCLTPNNSFLFSAGREGLIKKIDTIKMTDSSERNVLAKISDHSGEVRDLQITTNSSKLLILVEGDLLVWSIIQESLIKKVNLDSPCGSIYIRNLKQFFYLQGANGFEVWSLKDYEFKTKIEYKDLKCFTFFSDETKIAIKYSNKVESFESPMFSKHIKVIGENIEGNSREFFKYANEIITGKSEFYQNQFRNWIIMPFMMNIQHLYAYYNYDNYLKYAFIKNIEYDGPDKQKFNNTGDAPYLKSANGHTVLSIALDQDFPECIKVSLKCMKSRWLNNPYSLATISDSLIKLNNSGIDGLQKLYDFALRKHFFKNLPGFCSNTNLPIIMYSDSIEVDSEMMLGANANIKDGTAIAFDHSCFQVIMNLGSSEGIDFMMSLVECPNERVFETRFIRLLLQEKWKRARFLMYGQASLYLAYVITLAVYSTTELENKTFLIIPAAINASLFIYELYQMGAGGLDYFKDIWNYVDMIRSSLFFIYAVLIWVGYFDNHTDFLALVILITWVRGITYFRLFESTRYLINLLFEVFKDIPAFLIIFFYTILAFSFIFYTLDKTENFDNKYYSTFVSTYSTTLGNSDTGSYDELQWLFYLFITLLNFIIMLNLLISILSDTYERVNEIQIIADGKELASMIMEVELMLFWRKNLNNRQYIHVCRDESSEEVVETQVILDKFKNMSRMFNDYQDKVEFGATKLDEMKNEIERDNVVFNELIKKSIQKFKIK